MHNSNGRVRLSFQLLECVLLRLPNLAAALNLGCVLSLFPSCLPSFFLSFSSPLPPFFFFSFIHMNYSLSVFTSEERSVFAALEEVLYAQQYEQRNYCHQKRSPVLYVLRFDLLGIFSAEIDFSLRIK